MFSVVIEGGDAVGKHSHTSKLVRTLRDQGIKTLTESFPRYETIFGKAIKRHLAEEILMVDTFLQDGETAHLEQIRASVEDALAFQALFCIDRTEFAPLLEDETRAGTVVVLDRWWQSGAVYGSSDGLSREQFLRISSQLPQAELNILLDLPPEVAADRRTMPRDRYERNRPKMEMVRKGYRKLWEERALATPYADGTWVVVNSNQAFDVVAAEIWNHVCKAAFAAASKGFEFIDDIQGACEVARRVEGFYFTRKMDRTLLAIVRGEGHVQLLRDWLKLCESKAVEGWDRLKFDALPAEFPPGKYRQPLYTPTIDEARWDEFAAKMAVMVLVE